MITSRSSGIFQDWPVNQSGKSKVFVASFRAAQAAQTRGRLVALLARMSYQFLSSWVLGVEFPLSVVVGPRLSVPHPVAIVVNPGTIIGSNCVIRHCTTIGNRPSKSGAPGPSPRIGNRVDLGSNSVVIGDIQIGDGARVGAGAIVVKDVLPGETMIGRAATPLSPSASVLVDPNGELRA